MNSRAKKALETRQRILDVGVALIEERGYSNVSIEDIVQASGVSVGTFYHYFDSKVAFYYTHFGKIFSAADDALLERMDLSPIDNLNAYVTTWLDAVGSVDSEYISQWLAHLTDPGFHNPIDAGQDISAKHMRALCACIEGYVERGVLTDKVRTHMVAQTIITLLYGIDVRYCMAGNNLKFERWYFNIKAFIYKNIAPFMVVPPERPEFDIDFLSDIEFDESEYGRSLAQ